MYGYQRRWLRRLMVIVMTVVAILIFVKRDVILDHLFNQFSQSTVAPKTPQKEDPQKKLATQDFTNQQVIAVNDNQPNFTTNDLKTDEGPWQKLSHRDWLGRPRQANALLNKQQMPTTKRKALTVKAPGYHVYQFKQNNQQVYLYNRSHLIGYQLTGLNNDVRNLVTGTRAMNAIHEQDNQASMETYENQIATYLRQSSKHYVRYQVTPLYRNVERIPRGIELAGHSIGDDVIKFHVYIFNSQPGWQINYYTGTALQQNEEK